jgi:septal ring factor EnvC (AmiA/AmiB activator)
MNEKMIDFAFKALSAGLVPILFWVNSQSVQIAVIKDQLKSNTKELDALRVDQRSLRDHQKETEAVLRELGVTMGFIKEVVTEIKDELKSR